jgi:F0F1-type ATP synthase epsilon subunit
MAQAAPLSFDAKAVSRQAGTVQLLPASAGRIGIGGGHAPTLRR